ncbi:MAG: carboxypeptidase regulatory-like domain-containing protein, partial [Bryobacterales bacterium]|nr:carboxypeptidase regulatory-like domain-containing protein [Bryobacterales bacterium]
MLSRRLACSLAAVLLLPAALSAQTTFATITGTVTDSTGAVIGSATVTATSVETNIVTTAQANEVGIYTLAQLKEGTYTVKARATGFKEYVAQNVVLISRDLRRLDIQLDVGSVET